MTFVLPALPSVADSTARPPTSDKQKNAKMRSGSPHYHAGAHRVEVLVRTAPVILRARAPARSLIKNEFRESQLTCTPPFSECPSNRARPVASVQSSSAALLNQAGMSCCSAVVRKAWWCQARAYARARAHSLARYCNYPPRNGGFVLGEPVHRLGSSWCALASARCGSPHGAIVGAPDGSVNSTGDNS
jgi:hypothetical protein